MKTAYFHEKNKLIQWFVRHFPSSDPPKMNRNHWFPLIFHQNRWSSGASISATTWSLIMYWHKINIYAASSRDWCYQKDHTVGGSSIKLMKREQNFAKNPTFRRWTPYWVERGQTTHGTKIDRSRRLIGVVRTSAAQVVSRLGVWGRGMPVRRPYGVVRHRTAGFFSKRRVE